MKNIFAYCWQSGLIEFGKKVPGGAFNICSGLEKIVKEKIYGCARLSYDNKSWLVPGVPEENDPIKKVDIFIAWQKRAFKNWYYDKKIGYVNNGAAEDGKSC